MRRQALKPHTTHTTSDTLLIEKMKAMRAPLERCVILSNLVSLILLACKWPTKWTILTATVTDSTPMAKTARKVSHHHQRHHHHHRTTQDSWALFYLISIQTTRVR